MECLSTSMDNNCNKTFLTTNILGLEPYTNPREHEELEHYSRKPQPEGLVKLFHKTVTSSDIKQYRLALPKNEVKKHFPMQFESTSRSTLICMEDFEGKVWRFRYTFWKSCQGYVFTSQWNQFVKENGVNAGDMVSFFQSTGPDTKLYIDWEPRTQLHVNEYHPEREGQVVKLFGVNICQI